MFEVYVVGKLFYIDKLVDITIEKYGFDVYLFNF